MLNHAEISLNCHFKSFSESALIIMSNEYMKLNIHIIKVSN